MLDKVKKIIKKNEKAYKAAKKLYGYAHMVTNTFSKAPETLMPEPVRILDELAPQQAVGTVEELKTDFCTGCSACFNACPVSAIQMVPDAEDGYWIRKVDFNKCIHCGKCARVCPVIHPVFENNKDPQCYAYMAEDEVRRQSSSGGAFHTIATHVLQNKGYVCGVKLSPGFLPEHVVTNDAKDLPELQRSKYVQSKVGSVYTQVKELLDKGEKVLFSGCPCQVAGLKSFLGKPYENLLAVDIVCHGAPSPMVFQHYLKENYDLSKLKTFHFRTKKFGYNSFHQTATYDDGTQISSQIAWDDYEKTMHSGQAIKPICADCIFAPAPRQGDLTIGDFWGIGGFKAEYNDQLGTSCVLINNAKGEAVFNEVIKKNPKLLQPVPFDFARRHNRFGKHMRVPGGRKMFYHLLKHQSLKKALLYASQRRFDVGLIGLWYGRNYGSIATYYALHYILQNELGLAVLMISNPLGMRDETNTPPYQIANKFYDCSKKYDLADIKILNNHCDTFMVGSDQLWNIYLSRPYKYLYYLDFVEEGKKRISYATSFGISYRANENETLSIRHYLEKFDGLSVRDDLSKTILKKHLGLESTMCLDPVLLCLPEYYAPVVEMANPDTLKNPEEYIVAYILDPDGNTAKNLIKIASALQKKVILILNESPKVRNKNVETLALPAGQDKIILTENVGLPEFLYYFQNAQSVVTDSFHGTVFSILFNKPFLARMNKKRGAERFKSLLNSFKISGRLYDDMDKLANDSAQLNEMDYAAVNKRLQELRKASLEWLRHALFSKKTSTGLRIYESEVVSKRSIIKS